MQPIYSLTPNVSTGGNQVRQSPIHTNKSCFLTRCLVNEMVCRGTRSGGIYRNELVVQRQNGEQIYDRNQGAINRVYLYCKTALALFLLTEDGHDVHCQLRTRVTGDRPNFSFRQRGYRHSSSSRHHDQSHFSGNWVHGAQEGSFSNN